MEASRMRVCFNDDAPRIGSGWRIITAKIGRKIVHVADQHGNRAKFSKEVWKQIAGNGNRNAGETKASSSAKVVNAKSEPTRGRVGSVRL